MTEQDLLTLNSIRSKKPSSRRSPSSSCLQKHQAAKITVRRPFQGVRNLLLFYHLQLAGWPQCFTVPLASKFFTVALCPPPPCQPAIPFEDLPPQKFHALCSNPGVIIACLNI